jgi:hypothetical protein
MIAHQATEWTNEEGGQKDGFENSAAPGAMDAQTVACGTAHRDNGPPYGMGNRSRRRGLFRNSADSHPLVSNLAGSVVGTMYKKEQPKRSNPTGFAREEEMGMQGIQR